MFDFLFGKKKKSATILFDMGGTNMRVARASKNGFQEVHIEKTPKDQALGLQQLITLARKAAGNDRIEKVIGCIAGVVNEGVVSGARNLPAWNGKNIVASLSTALNAQVQVLNDGELVGLGEYTDGAGRGAHTLAYITVSTGVGGARIHEGKIDFDASSLVVGRIPIGDSDLESQVSGTAVFKKFGIEPFDLDSVEEKNKIADMIAQGLVTVVSQWKPDTIVIGGSLMVGKRNTIPLERIKETLGELMQGSIPTLKLSELKDLGGLHGARALASL